MAAATLAELSNAFADGFGHMITTTWFSPLALSKTKVLIDEEFDHTKAKPGSLHDTTSTKLSHAFAEESLDTSQGCKDANTSSRSSILVARKGASGKGEQAGLRDNILKPSASEMKRIFQMFDEDNDGAICAKDLHGYMTRVGFELSEREVDLLLKNGDHNGDGIIDLEEFLSLYESLCTENDGMSSSSGNSKKEDDEESTMFAAFEVFDKNQDGVITAQELQTVLNDMGMAEGRSLQNCKKMIQAVDSDGNGEIDLREFKALLCSDSFRI